MAWYKKCDPVPWQPPSIVFQIVWPILYILYAIVLVLEQSDTTIRNLLLVGLVLNFSWVPAFTYNVKLALLILSGRVVVSVQTILALRASDIKNTRAWTEQRSLLFAPYMLWISFAWTLNAYLAFTC